MSEIQPPNRVLIYSTGTANRPIEGIEAANKAGWLPLDYDDPAAALEDLDASFKALIASIGAHTPGRPFEYENLFSAADNLKIPKAIITNNDYLNKHLRLGDILLSRNEQDRAGKLSAWLLSLRIT